MQGISGRSHSPLLQALNNAADGGLQLARRVKIDEKKDLRPFLPFGYNFCNAQFYLSPLVFSTKTGSHQFSCKIQVITRRVGNFYWWTTPFNSCLQAQGGKIWHPLKGLCQEKTPLHRKIESVFLQKITLRSESAPFSFSAPGFSNGCGIYF